MTQNINHGARSPSSLPLLGQHWRGLGGWNYYFLLKFGLLWYGYLNFHPLANLVLAAFLLLPIPGSRLHRLRHWLAVPFGLGLFYHDTWLPGVDSLLSQGDQLAGLSAAYLLELVLRFINLQMLGTAFVLWVAYLFLAQWLRFTVLVVAALGWLNVLNVSGPAVNLLPMTAPPLAERQPDGPAAVPARVPSVETPATNQNLNAALDAFYQQERQRRTEFPSSLPADAVPFDLLVINVCSLSWSDLEAVELASHPLWQRFDIRFQDFNSATSYSGPAGIRLLRASCGQSPQQELYQPADPRCYLFDNLAQLGFSTRLGMDHSGDFGGYLAELRRHGNLQAPLMSQQGMSRSLVSFDGEPVLNDAQLFSRWLSQQQGAGDTRSATFFNLIPLHDGNRLPGQNETAPYRARARTLFDQLDAFFDQLAQSGRRLMVVVVPEHGAGLVGDKVQLSGLRDIPSPSMTRVPVGIKLFGTQAPHQGQVLEIKAPSSYLALSELIARLVDGKVFGASDIDWQALVQGLPQTTAVSENDNAVVMEFQGNSHIRLNEGDWVPYPR
ncbi:cellulose biosynthesis protein BcsG [Zobellella aerophila]|uniref:Cellulose biosynthesis protein BcsG n=1 Tax=Zobellella aerophila TaxID=870480 RepID=A0ABP6WGV1_9GAMM